MSVVIRNQLEVAIREIQTVVYRERFVQLRRPVGLFEVDFLYRVDRSDKSVLRVYQSVSVGQQEYVKFRVSGLYLPCAPPRCGFQSCFPL